MVPTRHEVRQIVTLNGSKEQTLPVYNVEIHSINGEQVENIEVTGSQMPNFTTIQRPNISELKEKLAHARDKQFYVTKDNKYPIDLIIGDNLYCKIKNRRNI